MNVILVVILSQFLIVKVVNVLRFWLNFHICATGVHSPQVDLVLLHADLVNPLGVPVAQADKLAQVLAVLVTPELSLLALFARPIIVDLGEGRLVPPPRQDLGHLGRQRFRATVLTGPDFLRNFFLRRIQTLQVIGPRTILAKK